MREPWQGDEAVDISDGIADHPAEIVRELGFPDVDEGTLWVGHATLATPAAILGTLKASHVLLR